MNPSSPYKLAAIRYELGLTSSFEFVEGTVPATQAAGIDSLVRPGDVFFIYFEPQSADTICKAVDDLQRYMEQVGVDITRGHDITRILPDPLQHLTEIGRPV